MVSWHEDNRVFLKLAVISTGIFGFLTFLMFTSRTIGLNSLSKFVYYLNLVIMLNSWVVNWLYFKEGLGAELEGTWRKVAWFNIWVIIILFIVELPGILISI